MDVTHFAGEGCVITVAVDIRHFAGEGGVISVAVDIRHLLVMVVSLQLQWISDTLLV